MRSNASYNSADILVIEISTIASPARRVPPDSLVDTSVVISQNACPLPSPWLALALAPFGFVMLGGVERKRARWVALALMLIILLAAVGCGGGGMSSTPATTTTTHQATASTV